MIRAELILSVCVLQLKNRLLCFAESKEVCPSILRHFRWLTQMMSPAANSATAPRTDAVSFAATLRIRVGFSNAAPQSHHTRNALAWQVTTAITHSPCRRRSRCFCISHFCRGFDITLKTTHFPLTLVFFCQQFKLGFFMYDTR